jgi:hypothetical protein
LIFAICYNLWDNSDVKITKFGHAVEARTVEWSSLVSLVHPYGSLLSKGTSFCFAFLLGSVDPALCPGYLEWNLGVIIWTFKF